MPATIRSRRLPRGYGCFAWRTPPKVFSSVAYYELKLDRQEHPMFTLSWRLFHTIDEDSPLHGMTDDEFVVSDAALALNVSGVDDSSAQHLYARELYAHDDIRWRYRYRDMTSISAEGRLLIDYSRFHDVTPDRNSGS